ncbi:MAG: protoporphyrinogen oxidase HemJ [Methylocella sp.]|nr:MAG: protoporphyrinogen oxidase HemJ [Hyphomicrobiales bacterium]
MSNLYLSIKVLHILAIISWMAGMLYLPRLFVYHAEAPRGSPQARTFVVMERRLMRAIMLPAFLATWSTGVTLAVQAGFLHAGWFHAKFALVIGLSALHGYFAKFRKDLADETNRHGSRFFRIVNEAPTVLMAAVVILVVFKPF